MGGLVWVRKKKVRWEEKTIVEWCCLGFVVEETWRLHLVRLKRRREGGWEKSRSRDIMGFGFREKLRLRCKATTGGGKVIEVRATNDAWASLSLSLSLLVVVVNETGNELKVKWVCKTFYGFRGSILLSTKIYF